MKNDSKNEAVIFATVDYKVGISIVQQLLLRISFYVLGGWRVEELSLACEPNYRSSVGRLLRESERFASVRYFLPNDLHLLFSNSSAEII